MSHFVLDIKTDQKKGEVTLRLSDKDGVQLGSNSFCPGDHSPDDWEGLFNTAEHVSQNSRHNSGEGKIKSADDLLAEIGTFIGSKILGPEIMDKLDSGIDRRALYVRVPETAGDILGAAFARVPWEIARFGPDHEPLCSKNISTTVLSGDAQPDPDKVATITPKPDESLRVLLVFAEVSGSAPLATRQERERLLRLFFDEVHPHKRVEVNTLCHGVTDAMLRDKIQKNRGYHIIHWIGRSHLGMLELAREKGDKKDITAPELLGLIKDAGGVAPNLFFLSARDSGDIPQARSSEEFKERLLTESEPPRKKDRGKPVDPDKPLERDNGFTGAALSLLHAGVPQVVATRYPVGDTYASHLTERFYRHLIADKETRPADTALALARSHLANDKERAGHYLATDHAATLIFGHINQRFSPHSQRSPQLADRLPLPFPLLSGGGRDLDPPRLFLGRGRELASLHREWLSKEGPAVAAIQGLAGMGKTSLAAESINLWHTEFDFVLAFQFRDRLVSVEEFYGELDLKLLHDPLYVEKCLRSRKNAVYIPVDSKKDFKGEARYTKLRENLVAALQDEKILLILDSFETLSGSEKDGGYGRADPEWDEILKILADNLQGTSSRLLITTRHKIASLSNDSKTLWLPLGPLTREETVWFIRDRKDLMGLFRGDAREQELARRAVDAGRGHPLILNQLANMAKDRKLLKDALDAIQERNNGTLPDFFAEKGMDEEEERKYLKDVMEGIMDTLIERQPEQGRRLLWTITLAFEPVTDVMARGVWSGISVKEEALKGFKEMLSSPENMPPELKENLDKIPKELLQMLNGLKGEKTDKTPQMAPLIESLCGAGLIHKEGEGEYTPYGFHELARERIGEWMKNNPNERGGRSDKDVLAAYGERYGAAFQGVMQSDEEEAKGMATEAGKRGITYLVRAEKFEQLAALSTVLVTSVDDIGLLKGIIPELEEVSASLPAGKTRRELQLTLAGALRKSGDLERSLTIYEESASEADKAEDWADVGTICQNWANAIRITGDLEKAHETYIRSAEAAKKAGSPRVNALANELEALRLQITRGRAEEALPEINSLLDEARKLWKQCRREEKIPQDQDKEIIFRAFISGLDIACKANQSLSEWQASIDLLNEQEEVMRKAGAGKLELAGTRFNRYGSLINLGRLGEAKGVVKQCLKVYQKHEDLYGQSQALSALANICDETGDAAQAELMERQSLALCERMELLEDLAGSHHNLADYLEKNGKEEESAQHLLAAIAYYLVCGNEQSLQESLHNYAIDLRTAMDRGNTHQLPRLAYLMTLPQFHSLPLFIKKRGINTEGLQQAIDYRLDEVQRIVQKHMRDSSDN